MTQTQLRIGPHTVQPPVVLAPMAGITNAPFRTLCREFSGGKGLFVSEMITTRALVERDAKTMRLVHFDGTEKPRSIQLYGVDPVTVGKAVRMIVDEDLADHIDLNFGCPVPKVTRKGGGSALPYKRNLLRAILREAVTGAGALPVTMKMRKGIDDDHITYLDAGRIAVEEGVTAIALHGRTAAQHYGGTADWDAIARLKETVPEIPANRVVLPDGLRILRYSCAHDATTCSGGEEGRGQRGHGQPGAQRQARSLRATRQAVLSALDVLGYERPTQLRGERARLVGLVLPELQNPIFPAFAEVIGGALAQTRPDPGAVHPDQGRRLRGRLRDAAAPTAGLRRGVRGGLYAQADAPHDHYRLLAERNIPVVLVNAAIDHLGFPGVSCDDAVAVEQAWRHLASLGHERIGLVLGPGDHMPSRRKLAAARASRRTCPTSIVARAIFSIEGGHAAATRLLDRGVTGIICASDPLALGAVRAARRKGLDVPSQISVVGYDDSAFMNCTEPPLTTVRQPIEAMGRAPWSC
jgi:DNA-binding LacI/PurR family transcriptional regulator